MIRNSTPFCSARSMASKYRAALKGGSSGMVRYSPMRTVRNLRADIQTAGSVLRIDDADAFPELRIAHFRMRSLNQPEAQQERALGLTAAGWSGNAQLETRHGAACLANLNCHDDPPLYMM